MLSPKLKLKLYLEGTEAFDAEPIVPVFHRFIREHALPDEILIDVTSYTHVPSGPGVLLIGHQSDYGIDFDEGRPGLSYFRKREAPAESARLGEAVSRTLRVAELLEKESALAGRKFSTSELLLEIPDRLTSPNADATLDRERDKLLSFFERLCGPVTLSREGSPREPFRVRISAKNAGTLSSLRQKLG
jgi:hypothetical protein